MLRVESQRIHRGDNLDYSIQISPPAMSSEDVPSISQSCLWPTSFTIPNDAIESALITRTLHILYRATIGISVLSSRKYTSLKKQSHGDGLDGVRRKVHLVDRLDYVHYHLWVWEVVSGGCRKWDWEGLIWINDIWSWQRVGVPETHGVSHGYNLNFTFLLYLFLITRRKSHLFYSS
jgi:hypothetical protein